MLDKVLRGGGGVVNSYVSGLGAEIPPQGSGRTVVSSENSVHLGNSAIRGLPPSWLVSGRAYARAVS